MSRCAPKGTRGQGFRGSSDKVKKSNLMVMFASWNSDILAGDLDLIEKGESGKKDIAEVEIMLKALIKSIKKLESLTP